MVNPAPGSPSSAAPTGRTIDPKACGSSCCPGPERRGTDRRRPRLSVSRSRRSPTRQARRSPSSLEPEDGQGPEGHRRRTRRHIRAVHGPGLARRQAAGRRASRSRSTAPGHPAALEAGDAAGTTKEERRHHAREQRRCRSRPSQNGTACCAPDSAGPSARPGSTGARSDLGDARGDQARRSPPRTPRRSASRSRSGPSTVWKGQPQVKSFTTYHGGGEARVTNIHLIADAVRGTIVKPGETFSLNGRVGKRTPDEGLRRGRRHLQRRARHRLSAAACPSSRRRCSTPPSSAGMDFVSYQSHSIHFDRYPYGREATLGWETPDQKWKNNTPYGVMIWTTYTDTSITVTLWSTQNVYGQQTAQTSTKVGNGCTRVRTTAHPLLGRRPHLHRPGRLLYRPAEGVDCPGPLSAALDGAERRLRPAAAAAPYPRRRGLIPMCSSSAPARPVRRRRSPWARRALGHGRRQGHVPPRQDLRRRPHHRRPAAARPARPATEDRGLLAAGRRRRRRRPLRAARPPSPSPGPGHVRRRRPPDRPRRRAARRRPRRRRPRCSKASPSPAPTTVADVVDAHARRRPTLTRALRPRRRRDVVPAAQAARHGDPRLPR